MSSNLCNTSALSSILTSLNGSSSNATSNLSTLLSVATEARSVAVSSNTLAYSDDSSSSSSSNNGGGTVGTASAVSAEMIKGLRNRIFLKYAGIEYEFYNVYDLQYRTSV